MIAACLKWVDARAEVDRLSGDVSTADPRTAGASDADLAALEWALRVGDVRGEDVTVVTVGPAEADEMLRDAIAAGAARAVRVDLPVESASASVAAAIADVVRGASFVVCGAWSVDRGSGSVPAFVAAHLDAAQALGCVTLSIDEDGAAGMVTAERRLDGGRRERVRAHGPCVFSVEGGSARLRRAPLRAVVLSRDTTIDVVRPSTQPVTGGAVRRSPFRPRARVLPPPSSGLSARERILALTGALTEREPPQLLVLEPDAAADRILDQLRAWGYVE